MSAFVPAISDYPISSLHPAKVVARELLALAASSLLYPFNWAATARDIPRQKEQRTVVLVHGYMANRSSFLPLATYLKATGVKLLLAYDYPGAHGIERAAIGLRDFLKQHARGGRIDLVGHSLGGLIARVYLQELGGARRVDRCITLGTPHRGTYNAYWVTSRVGRELRPDSPLLARLERSRPAAARVKFTSIVAGSDNIVIPRVFAANEEDVIHIPDLGHVGMLFSPTVFRAISDRLRTPPAHRAPSRQPDVA